MKREEILQKIKTAKQLYIDHPEYWGMCHCLSHAFAGTSTGATIYTIEDIERWIPEFNREFLGAPKSRYGKAYWWEPNDEEGLGEQARLDAFNKLIAEYEN